MNADVTFSHPLYAGVLDGVSGVAQYGFKPEDLPWELRNVLKFYMHKRACSESTQTFDKEVQSLVGQCPTEKGAWLRNLLTMSMMECSLKGATTHANG